MKNENESFNPSVEEVIESSNIDQTESPKEKPMEEISDKLSEKENNATQQNSAENPEIDQFLERAVDLRDGKGLLVHVTSTGSLSKILKQGILSHDFYKKLRRQVRPKLPTGFNPLMQREYGFDKISFTDGDSYQKDSYKKFKNTIKNFETLAKQILLEDKNKGGFKYALEGYDYVAEYAKAIREKGGFNDDLDRNEKGAINSLFPALKPYKLKEAKLFFNLIKIWDGLIIKKLNDKKKQINDFTDKELSDLFDNLNGQLENEASELCKDVFPFIESLSMSGGGRSAVLIDKNMLPSRKQPFNIYDKGAWENEAMIKNRIAPRFFKGFIIPNDRDLNKIINDDKSVEQLKRFKIPLYDMDGNMIWPQKITAKELQTKIRGEGVDFSKE